MSAATPIPAMPEATKKQAVALEAMETEKPRCATKALR
jgi:hypothetical protein